MTCVYARGLAGRYQLCVPLPAFCSFLTPIVPQQEEMGEVPNLTNGAIQVSLPENSPYSVKFVRTSLLQDILAGMQLSRPVLQVLVSTLSSPVYVHVL